MSEASEAGSESNENMGGVYQTKHEWGSGHDLSVTVIMALHRASDFNMLNGDRILSEYINLNALDALFNQPLGDTPASAEAKVSFTVEEYTIEVSGSGRIVIKESDE